MKKTIFFFVALLCTTAMHAQAEQPAAKKGAAISFTETTHNFGIFDVEHGTQTCHFVFTNTGSETLIISDAYASCGCTIPEFPKTGILPGEKDSITVTYNGATRRPGVFRKVVTVTFNGPTADSSLARIYITGEMVENKPE